MSKVRLSTRISREQLRRAIAVLCLFMAAYVLSAKSIAYYIEFQVWSVSPKRAVIVGTVVEVEGPAAPAWWNAELSAAAWSWGVFLAIAVTACLIFLWDKARNFVKIGRVSGTTEAAMRSAVLSAIGSLGVLPRNGAWHWRVAYDQSNSDTLLVLCNGEEASCRHNIDGFELFAVSPKLQVVPRIS